jgi:hypothetical protein
MVPEGTDRATTRGYEAEKFSRKHVGKFVERNRTDSTWDSPTEDMYIVKQSIGVETAGNLGTAGLVSTMRRSGVFTG